MSRLLRLFPGKGANEGAIPMEGAGQLHPLPVPLRGTDWPSSVHGDG
jgi:hypothetical protein